MKMAEFAFAFDVWDDWLLNIILEEFDDEEDEEEVVIPGQDFLLTIDIENWKRAEDPEFQKHFRMSRDTFEALLLALGRHLKRANKIRRKSKKEKGLDFALMMVLWILATPDTFRSVSVKFGVRQGVVHFHYKYIIEALREMSSVYIKWPNDFEKERIAEEFENRYGYPSVIGCIDGCLIQITKPKDQPEQYVDWHRHYSITVQAVCDDTLLFRDVYVGEAGSVGDKRTFKRSPLGHNILEPTVMSDKILLGDGGYTLMSKLMIPYRDNGNLTARMRSHNYHLSRCRATIERAFALDEGRALDKTLGRSLTFLSLLLLLQDKL